MLKKRDHSIYSTGILGFVATVTSLLATVQIHQNFNKEYPIIFFGAQIILILFFVIGMFFAFIKWKKESSISRWILLRSAVVCILMYFMAYTGSKYSFILILIVGETEVYLTRKRFGLVK